MDHSRVSAISSALLIQSFVMFLARSRRLWVADGRERLRDAVGLHTLPRLYEGTRGTPCVRRARRAQPPSGRARRGSLAGQQRDPR
jgi:hypothetical protein